MPFFVSAKKLRNPPDNFLITTTLSTYTSGQHTISDYSASDGHNKIMEENSVLFKGHFRILSVEMRYNSTGGQSSI